MNYFARFYKYANEEITDPRTKDWLFVSSPSTILFIILLYLFVVRKLGPKFMKNRKPYNVDGVMIVYNILQIFLSSFIVIEIIRSYFVKTKPNLFCDAVNTSTEEIYLYHAFIVQLYFFAKLLELFDTIFFILRKKWNQISTLHVFHHSGMVFVGWVAIKYVPGGHSMLTLALNSFVHIVMYIYYLLLSVNPNLRTSIWWKKHITQLQLTQFFIILFHHLSAFIVNCGYPKTVSFWVLNHIIFIAALFTDFYVRTYI
ncbi:very long chain fatty acid elongase AAEL008004-like [Planococcus citri]|uniref:very long chain fatty acid elongase AAEL008004-like n=1 Tax=Planococcus citri TaxID=170843 RepID=UPI0031F879E8